jgi:DNA polymerase
MAEAAYNGLPLSLDLCAKALPELGIVKDKPGHALMMRMSRPRMWGKTPDLDTWWHLDEPSRFDTLCAYCAQDVRVERAISTKLKPLPPRERKIWELDAEINIRGMLLDVDLALKIRTLAHDVTEILDQDMRRLTGGEVSSTRSIARLLMFVQKYDPSVSSLGKDVLDRLIEDFEANLDFVPAQALRLRQEAAKSSVAKVNSMLAYANVADDRMRGLYQYYAAFRTGRDGGRGPQIQNYPRGQVKDQAALVSYIKNGGDIHGFEMFFGVDAMTALSSALRGCVTVPNGRHFCSYDFSQIEARVTPWLAGDWKKLDVFKSGKDVYVVAAAGIYKVPEGAVDKDQRQIGKVSELALGFGGGVGAFQSMAKLYGLEMSDDDADEIKVEWRKVNTGTVRLWYQLDDAALDAVRTPGKSFQVGFLFFEMREGHLYLRLPSGRELCYRNARIGVGKFGNDCVEYDGIDPYTKQWGRVQSYGGKWCENATQAVARDVMKAAELRLAKLDGVWLLGPIHDELLMELDDPSRVVAVSREMHRVPPWCPGLPIDAAGYVSDRFKKD